MGGEPVVLADGIASIRIAGVLDGPAVSDLQAQLREAVRLRPKLRVLLRAEEFSGWGTDVDWNDLSFQVFQDAIDPHIERLAVVVDARWRDAVLVFLGGDLRPFPIACFTPTESVRALAWLAEK